MMVTANEVQKAVIDNNINVIPHHECAICGEWVAYEVYNKQLFFNSNCGCSSFWSPVILCSWQDAADFINMQSNPRVRVEIASLFGLTISCE